MTDLPGRRPPPIAETTPTLCERIDNLRHLGRLVAQIWSTSKALTVAGIGLRLIGSLQPIAMLYVGKLIIDAVVGLTNTPSPGPAFADWWASGLLLPIAILLAIELALVLISDLLSRITGLVDSVLAELHSNTVSVELAAHAARLDLVHFESAEYQDKLERAQRQAAGRNALLSQMFGQAQDIITVATLAAGLFVYAPRLILLLPLNFVPAVWGEARFNTLAYMMSRWRTPERRELEYIRHVGASAETAKEIKPLGLGGFLIERFKMLAQAIFLENRYIAMQRSFWGALFSAITTLTYYGAYGFIAWRTIVGDFSIGDLAFLSGSFLRLNGLFQKLLLGFTQIAGQSMYLDDLFSFFEIEPSIVSPAPRP
ncbi:MAG: ABC transporter ATP-binding protein, partial [Candidatus Devosia euplotis]|nr:ABC transporter ATP-binding protein [Candidatus Devosia euplotis]